MQFLVRVSAVALAMAACAPAIAASPLLIANGFNDTLAGYADGWAYPEAGSTVTINGVDFDLPGEGGPAQIVQTTYRGHDAEVIFSVAPTSGIATLYTLISTAHGNSTGEAAGRIDFLFGEVGFSYELVSGANVRDHYGSVTASDLFGTVSYGNVHFDAQRIDVPTVFQSFALTEIRLVDYNPIPNAPWYDTGGQPFLAAISFDGALAGAVPEPATWAMMIGGIGAAGGALRRRRAGTAALA